MSENITDPTEEIREEVQAERRDYDLIDRLVKRPKRKPEVVTLYLDEEKGEELGDARDVEIKNKLGMTVKTERFRAGVLGELDAERAKPEGMQDSGLIEELEARARVLVEEIRKDSITLTLQWIPPIAEDLLVKESLEAVGLKAKPVPESKIDEYKDEWLARAVVATLVSFKDNMEGVTRTKISLKEVQAVQKYLPRPQIERLDQALNRLLFRDAISREALDNADF